MTIMCICCLKLRKLSYLVFKAEIKCVYCAVQTESLTINQDNLSLQKVKVQYVDTKLV